MKILVTGATGFIGRHLVEFLKEKYEIHVLVRPASNTANYDYSFCFDNNIPALHEYLLKHQIEGIVHLASLVLISHKDTDIKNLIESNIFLGTAILEALQNTAVKWFLNTGTFWQHYEPETPDYHPVNLYAATKQSFIDIAKYYMEISHIKFVTLKICDTFGPGDTRPKIFSLWNKIVQTGEVLSMSEGGQYIDILYIDDVISGFARLIDLLNSNEELKLDYALYAEKRYTLKELADLYENTTGKRLNIRWGGRAYRLREVMDPWRAGNMLHGWKSEVSIREGILKSIPC